MGERDVTSPQIAVSLPSGPVMPEETSSPDISAGTASVVWLFTVVALRYQVASSASAAKFG